MEQTEPPQEPSPKAARNDVVKTIAQQLGETGKEPLQQLHMLVKKLGTEQALAFLNEALAIEAQGGQLLSDGSRRRTPGGVFFHLVRTTGPKEARSPRRKQPKPPKPEEGKAKEGKQHAQAATPAAPSPAALPWEDRLIVLQAIGTEKGTASTVKITLIGRPGKIVDKGSCVVTVMQASKVPALPKGLPVPPASTTHYVVYIAAKHWKTVAEVIRDPEDVLIVEGFPQLDPKTTSIAVFATTTTTKKLQAARRPPPAPREAR